MGQMLLTGAGGGASGPTTLILDQFTGTNGTALASHTIAPTNTPATSWTTDYGGNDIQSNGAHQASTGADTVSSISYLDAGDADVTITTDLITPASGAWNSVGITTRHTDYDNSWHPRVSKGSSQLQIYEFNAGVITLRASTAFVPAISTIYSLVVVTNGTSISLTVGVDSVSYASASFNQTVTKHGVRFVTGLGCLLDNFKVTSS